MLDFERDREKRKGMDERIRQRRLGKGYILGSGQEVIRRKEY
jgi:hypothetical protein